MIKLRNYVEPGAQRQCGTGSANQRDKHTPGVVSK